MKLVVHDLECDVDDNNGENVKAFELLHCAITDSMVTAYANLDDDDNEFILICYSTGWCLKKGIKYVNKVERERERDKNN